MSKKEQQNDDFEEGHAGGLSVEDGRRLTHNEVERRRRDNQRERLEELRSVIPNINDTRPSMIGTLIRAKEYIEQLQHQVRNLEKMMALSQMPPGNYASYSIPTAPNMSNRPSSYLTLPVPGTYSAPSGPVNPKTYPEHDPGLPLLAPKPAPYPAYHNMVLGKRRSTDSISDSPSEAVENSKIFRQGRHGSFANLFSIMEEAASVQQNHHPNNSAPPSPPSPDTGNADKFHTGRRKSSLLLPTADPNLFLFGRRDSMQNLFAAPLSLIMEQQDPPREAINCQKCKGNIENMIMIDCDVCHSWFHIKCIGLDPERIPIVWACMKCSKH